MTIIGDIKGDTRSLDSCSCGACSRLRHQKEEDVDALRGSLQLLAPPMQACSVVIPVSADGL